MYYEVQIYLKRGLNKNILVLISFKKTFGVWALDKKRGSQFS